MGLEQDNYLNVTMVKSNIDKMDSLYREYRYIEDSYASLVLNAIPPAMGTVVMHQSVSIPPPVPISPELTPAH